MYVHQLATCVRSDVVSVNTTCTGLVYTSFSSFFPFHLRIPVDLIMAIRARSVAVGTRLVINAAVLAGPEPHGKFLEDTAIFS